MSHYQSKGDRSEVQLKKPGRSSGTGHQRSGVPTPAVKGGGAGGPNPPGSAPPASSAAVTVSQSFTAAPTTGRPTTPGSSTNRSGKRGNGPAVQARNVQAGGPPNHGGNCRSQQYLGAQFLQPQHQQPGGQRDLGPTDSYQHLSTTTGQQMDIKQPSTPILQLSDAIGGSKVSTSGGAPASFPTQSSIAILPAAASRPPAPVVSSIGAAQDPLSPIATVASMDATRSAAQPSFSFQFGSITPGFMSLGPGMQIPARTSSAPPNLDEQKREQALFEASRAAVVKKVPTVPSGQQLVQATRVHGHASEVPAPVLQANQVFGSQGLLTGVGGPGAQPLLQTGSQVQLSAPPPMQYSPSPPIQGHGHQHSLASMHMPAHVQVSPQHMQHIQLAAHTQAQAQAHVQQQQQQVLSQQALPQQSLPQQGLVQQSQGMKFPQSMVPSHSSHGAQIISKQMVNPLGAQLPSQQLPSQIGHQLGPQMVSSMGGQLPPGMSGTQYGSPASISLLQPQKSRPVKIVNPDTLEELRFDAKAKKGETFVDADAPASIASGLPGRVSSNGPPRPMNYGSGSHSHHGMAHNMNYFQQIQNTPYMHASASFYQPLPSKNVSTVVSPSGSTPPVRYGHSSQAPFMHHPGGTVPNTPASKVGPSGGSNGSLGGKEMSGSSSASLAVGSSMGPSQPMIQTLPQLSGRPVPASQFSQLVMNPVADGQASTLVPSLVAANSSSTASIPNAVVDFQFGDVEASGSAAPVSVWEPPAENLAAAPPAIVSRTIPNSEPQIVNPNSPMPVSEGVSSVRDQGNKISTSANATPRPSLPLPSPKPTSAFSFANPRMSGGSSGGTVDKPKSEILKVATSNKEIPRKISKKEQKQYKQQQAQQAQTPLLAIPVVLDSEEEIKEGTTTITPGSGSISQISTAFSVAPVPVTMVTADLQQSQSELQSLNSVSSVSSKTSSLSESTRETFGTAKVAIDQVHVIEDSSGLSEKCLRESLSTSITYEDEDGLGKSFLKQVPGNVLSTVKGLEGKGVSITDSGSSSKGGTYSKLNSISSSEALSTGPPLKEPNVGRLEESLVPGHDSTAQVFSQMPDTNSAAVISAVGYDLGGLVESSGGIQPSLPVSGVLSDGDKSSLINASSYSEVAVEVAMPVSELTDPDFLVSNETDACSQVDEQVLVPKDFVLGAQLSRPDWPDSPDAAVSGIQCVVASPNVDQVEPRDNAYEERGLVHQTGPVGSERDFKMPVSGFEQLVTDGISLSKAMALEIEDSVVDFDSQIIDDQGKPPGVFLDSEVGSHENLVSTQGVREELSLTGSALDTTNEQPVEPSGQSVNLTGESIGWSDQPVDRVSASVLSIDTSEIQSKEVLSTESHETRDTSQRGLAIESLSSTEREGSSTFSQEIKQTGSKKKKKKEIFAKADAQGPTADLFTAYKAPEEKKIDEVKGAEALGCVSSEPETRRDFVPSRGKPVPKELDDWEDAAEIPAPKSAPISSSVLPVVNFAPDNAPNLSDFVVKRYTKDYLMSQREFHKDLPPMFEIRADIAEYLLTSQLGALTVMDAVSSPGRGLERHPSGGPRLDRRNSNNGVDEDRWTRQGGPVASPGRGPGDARVEIGMSGPPGSFRPGGQGTSSGLMRMPPGVRTVPPVVMPNAGLLPGAPLLPQHVMSTGSARNIAGIDADRWQRAPVGQKGLIPSPRTPLPAIHKTENRYQVGKVSDEEQLKQRLIKGILNKLTPQNFEKLFAQVKEVNIDTAATLTGVISQIFDKALTEPTFCEMYAKFCVQLAVELPEFVEEEEKITFKRVLLNKCQEEFEKGEREQEEAEKLEEEGEVKLTLEEREEKRTSARRRMLGNIRFIGELYKKNMLTERIMHECIKKLLGEYQNPDEEDVEALCKLMTTIGRIIDHLKAKEHIDAYFKRMEMLSENLKLSSRLRFMLKDVIDLRRSGWQERRKVEGPKKIDEVHRDAVQERQQAAASGRDRPQQRGGMVLGGVRRPGDFAMRGPPAPMFPQGTPGPVMQMGGIRNAPGLPGMVRGGFVQDVRIADCHVPMPLSQRTSDDGNLTLGPQGGLGRALRQPLGTGRSVLADVPTGMLGDGKRSGLGPMPFSMISDRGTYGGREEISMRAQVGDRHLSTIDRPLLERPLGPERPGPPPYGRDLRFPDRASLEKASPSVVSSVSIRPVTPPGPVAIRSSSATTIPLTEDDLKKKSKSTIAEYFSLGDMNEAALCVDDLKNPKFYPTMVSVWVSEALDKKDPERELLVKLLIYICKETHPPLLTHDHISKGFHLVLSVLEDTTVDVPKAPEYVARMLGCLILAGVFSLAHVGKLLKEGGTDPGALLDIGAALNMFGVVLDTIRREKGDAAMFDAYRLSKLNVEDFLSTDDKRKEGKFEMFLENKNLQSLYPMIPLEKYLREAFDRDEPISEILKWVERNIPQSTSSDPDLFRMIMTQVLRHSVPLDPSGKEVTPNFEKVLEVKLKKFVLLLKKCVPTNRRSAETMQRQYIVAVQLFANDLGHPTGLISTLFALLYREDVINEDAFVKWKDDVKDSTPGRDKAIKETFNWFCWLAEAPEEGGDDDE